MLTDDVLSIAAMSSLLAKLDNEQSQELEKLGLSNETIATLLTLDITEKTSLIKHASKYLKLNLDVESLEKLIKKLATLRTEHELESYFLIKYAPLKLMNMLFGMHATEFSQRRKRLGIDGKSGRPSHCDKDTGILIQDIWLKYSHLDLKDRYIKTSELSNQNLDTIWTIVQRYESDHGGNQL